MEEFVAEFGELSNANVEWLQNLYRFTEENILPEVHSGITCKELSRCLFKCLCRACLNCSCPCGQQGKDGLTLPLNYRFVSLSELQSQKSPCCSNLTWNTSEFEQWTLVKESFPIDHKALSRTNLLLCGFLTDKISITQGTSESTGPQSDGNLYLQCKNVFIPCEVLKLDPQSLEHLVLFPSWSYIPLSSGSRRPNSIEAGYLEIIETPYLVLPKQSVDNLWGPKPLNVLLPDAAIHLMDKRFICQRVKLNIAGELCRLSSVLSTRGKTFFFFFLSSFTTDICLPVVIQVPAKLMWHHYLEVSKQYIVTKVFVSRLQGTNYKVFVVSSSSNFYVYNEGLVKEQTLEEFIQASNTKLNPDACNEESFQIRPLMDWSTQSTIEQRIVQSKESKIASYSGVISRVLNSRAGLYELDGKVGLCVAYQQLVNHGRGLRPGAQVKVFDAHVHKVADHLPRIMLCCCLRSSLQITGFSRLSTEYHLFSPICNIYISLLFKYNLDLPSYLWLIHVIDTLIERFCPCFISQQQMLMCVSDFGVIGTIFSSILNYTKWNSPKPARDIYQEILAESHHCPVKEITHLNVPCQIPSLAQTLSIAEKRAWESLNLSSLLPENEIKHLVSSKLNSKLAWSFEVLKPEDFQPQMILNGVLQANSVTGRLQLVDVSGSLDCVVQNCEISETAFSDTMFLDCLVQLQKFQLVLERFMHCDFPSFKHLEDSRFIKKKHTRVYVQFCAGDVQVLRKGASPAGHTPAVPSPAGPSAAGHSPAVPSPAGLNAGPSPAGPSPAFPSPAGPSLAVPSPTGLSPAGPSPAVLSPAGPSTAVPSPAGPSTAVLSPAGPSTAVPSPAGPSTAVSSPAVPSPAGPSPAPPAATETSGRTSSCKRPCRSDEVTSAATNQRWGGPSLPKMPLLEEVVLQEGHVGESGAVCSHPSWSARKAAGSPSAKGRQRGAGTDAGPRAAGRRKRKAGSCGLGCVTHLLVVTHKDALMLRNCQYGRNEASEHTNGPGEVLGKRTKAGLAFHASAFSLGSSRQWKEEGSIDGLPELEADPTLCSEYDTRTQVQLEFMAEAVRWYHLISQGGVYRVIGPKQMDTFCFEQHSSCVPLKTLQSLNCPRYLVVQPDWKFHYISTFSCLQRSPILKKQINIPAYLERLTSQMPQPSTIQDVLSDSFPASLVSFTGIILERMCFEPKRRPNFPALITDIDTKDVLVPSDWCLKFTVGAIQNRAVALDVYIDILQLTYTIGVLPGSIVAFYDLERIVSRHNNVYCKFVPLSSVSVLQCSLEAKSSSSSTAIAERPWVHLGNLISGQESSLQGIVCCHVVTVQCLQLQWVCTRCSNIFKQGRCTRSSGPCLSADGVFHAKSKIIVEDGTAEAWVHCTDKQVADLLQLSSTEWEGLQQHVGQRGNVLFQYQGRSGHELHEETTGDVLMQYLATVCASTIVCRSIQLAFKVDSRGKPKLGHSETFQMRILKCGDHQYSTKMAPTLSLTCLDIKEVDYRMLCHLGKDRLNQ